MPHSAELCCFESWPHCSILLHRVVVYRWSNDAAAHTNRTGHLDLACPGYARVPLERRDSHPSTAGRVLACSTSRRHRRRRDGHLDRVVLRAQTSHASARCILRPALPTRSMDATTERGDEFTMSVASGWRAPSSRLLRPTPLTHRTRLSCSFKRGRMRHSRKFTLMQGCSDRSRCLCSFGRSDERELRVS